MASAWSSGCAQAKVSERGLEVSAAGAVASVEDIECVDVVEGALVEEDPPEAAPGPEPMAGGKRTC